MQPLRFHPILKRTLWGGRQLSRRLGKPAPVDDDDAESWEIVDLPYDVSFVNGGEYDGQSLRELIEREPETILGTSSAQRRFPLLVKFIDATRRLSVQVHPGATTSPAFPLDHPGKAELWVVIDAQPGASVSVGLKSGIGKAEFTSALTSGGIADCLNTYEVQPGDAIYLPPGTIHALGDGLLIAEIQQPCNVTYRLYDWGRVGRDGCPRELHIPEALDVMNSDLGPIKPLVPVPVPGMERRELLADTLHFVVYRQSGPGNWNVPQDHLPHVLTSLAGTAVCESAEGEWQLDQGQTLLLPAQRSGIQIRQNADSILLDSAPPKLSQT